MEREDAIEQLKSLRESIYRSIPPEGDDIFERDVTALDYAIGELKKQ